MLGSLVESSAFVARQKPSFLACHAACHPKSCHQLATRATRAASLSSNEAWHSMRIVRGRRLGTLGLGESTRGWPLPATSHRCRSTRGYHARMKRITGAGRRETNQRCRPSRASPAACRSDRSTRRCSCPRDCSRVKPHASSWPENGTAMSARTMPTVWTRIVPASLTWRPRDQRLAHTVGVRANGADE